MDAKRRIFAFGDVMFFDLVILGDTPDAWCAAQEAAATGYRCAVLRPDCNGGASAGVNAVIAAFGSSAQSIEEVPTRSKAPAELWRDAVSRHERFVAQFTRQGDVRVWRGPARLAGINSAEVFVAGSSLKVEAELLLIATGTTQRKAPNNWVDRSQFFVPEDVGKLTQAPRRLAVLGGSLTATAFANLFAAAGTTVTLIDAEQDHAGESRYQMIASNVGEIHSVADRVTIRCENGETVIVDAVLVADKRLGATVALGLATAELEADDQGRLWCDDLGFTWQPTIAAAGEVVGFPRNLSLDREAARRLVASWSSGRIAGRIDHGDPLPPAPRRRRVPKPRTAAEAAPALRLYTDGAND